MWQFWSVYRLWPVMLKVVILLRKEERWTNAWIMTNTIETESCEIINIFSRKNRVTIQDVSDPLLFLFQPKHLLSWRCHTRAVSIFAKVEKWRPEFKRRNCRDFESDVLADNLHYLCVQIMSLSWVSIASFEVKWDISLLSFFFWRIQFHTWSFAK